MTTSTRREIDLTLAGRRLPGGTITISPHQATIGDHAVFADTEPDEPELAHTVWFLIAALRGMGITVDELCSLAEMHDVDTLLFGNCSITQDRPLLVGHTYRTEAVIDDVGRRTTRDGSLLDNVTVTVSLADVDDGHRPVGSVTSIYLFKRGIQ